PLLRIDPSIEQAQVARLQHLRDARDHDTAEAALAALEEAARGTENLLPRILACVEANVTVGEISHRLRRVWGEYREALTV
ncbi:MAG: methylmalonyl-CoA mutase family protein, partial [Pyrinomonadaceae bacterium]